MTLSPSFSDLTNERPFPVTPDPQKPSQSSSPPLSLVGWLKTSAYPKNKYDYTPISESPENTEAPKSCESSQLKQNSSVNGKTKVFAKRNLENSYDELQSCSNPSKRCKILRSPNQGDEKLAIKLDVDTEDGQTEITQWLNDHSVSDIEKESQEENLSPCQKRTKQNRLSEVSFEQTPTSPHADGALQKTIVQSLIPLSAILKTPTRQNLHSRSCHSANKKYHPKTPNSSRKTPHKSSPVVMSGKQSILSYLNTNGSPSN